MAKIEIGAVAETSELTQGLTPEEDRELSHLNYLNEIGCLVSYKAERLIELRLKDRRAQIRELEQDEGAKTRRGFFALRRR